MAWDPNGILANMVREVLSQTNKEQADLPLELRGRWVNGRRWTVAELARLADFGPGGFA